MKLYPSFFLIFIGFIAGSCRSSKTMDNPFQGQSYYALLPDNFIKKYVINGDSIYSSRLNKDLQVVNNDFGISKTHEIVRKEDSYILYVEEWHHEGRSADPLRYLGFRVWFMRRHGKEQIRVSIDTLGYRKTLEACKKQKLWNFDDHFAYTLVSSAMLDSFKSFSNLTELDIASVCLLKKKAKEEYKKDEVQIIRTMKRDMYLSVTSKELLTRTLISMRINPMNFTNEELDRVFKMCMYKDE